MAEYTQLSDDEVRETLRTYGLSLERAELIKGGTSSTSYVVTTTDAQQLVLSVLNNTDAESAVEVARIMQYASDNGISVDCPVADLSGALVTSSHAHPTMLKRFVKGTTYQTLPFELLDIAGSTLASIHDVPVPDWMPQENRRLLFDNALFDNVVEQFPDHDFADWVLSRLEMTAAIFDDPGEFRFTHGDFFADNLVITPSSSIVTLDWEHASADLQLVDLGFALASMANVDGAFDARRMRGFLDGYESVRLLTPFEIEHLQLAMVYAATVLAYTRYLRNHILFPDPELANHHTKMQQFAESIQ